MKTLGIKKIRKLSKKLNLDIQHAKVANGSNHEILLMIKGNKCKILMKNGDVIDSDIKWVSISDL